MPHESTVDPEEPMHVKSWGDEPSSQNETPDRRRSTYGQIPGATPRLNPSMSIQTHPDLPTHVTHDHDNDGDADEDEFEPLDLDGEMDIPMRVTYTPPKRKAEQSNNGQIKEEHSAEQKAEEEQKHDWSTRWASARFDSFSQFLFS